MEEIKRKAKEILERAQIEVLKNEKEIIEKVDEIIKKEKLQQEDLVKLNEIEKYLQRKSKIINNDAAYKFLEEFATRINMQKTRKEDREAYKVILFKVKDYEGKEYFSLSREEINNEIEQNKQLFGSSPIIEVISQENRELYEVLEMISKMFS